MVRLDVPAARGSVRVHGPFRARDRSRYRAARRRSLQDVLRLRSAGRSTVAGALRLSLAWVPEEHGGKGLLISVGGSTFKFGVDTGGAWAAQADATFDE